MLRYLVLVDGGPCAVGLTWREALVQALGVIALISADPSAVATVTISEAELGEPRLSWRRAGVVWERLELPVWAENAA